MLFVCSQNRLRSPTAEQVFSTWPGLEVASAGLNHDAVTPLTPELLAWAEIVFVMERAHRTKLSKHFRRYLKNQRVINLGIPDDFDYMEPALIALLVAKA
ncbi:MAG: phosphotyrosine protein phosphatase, partial [Myxococcales bacterium]|nr:phosphotyrosine protein phosphatase [Myxococcales bacterium]